MWSSRRFRSLSVITFYSSVLADPSSSRYQKCLGSELSKYVELYPQYLHQNFKISTTTLDLLLSKEKSPRDSVHTFMNHIVNFFLNYGSHVNKLTLQQAYMWNGQTETPQTQIFSFFRTLLRTTNNLTSLTISFDMFMQVSEY